MNITTSCEELREIATRIVATRIGAYTTHYSSSNGQPTNGHESHETLAAALAAWKADIGSLLHRYGGDATLTEEATGSTISWIEHCEGGFITASGDFLDEVCHLARYEEENGESLTPEKLIKHLT
jgi:hypothetical protein